MLPSEVRAYILSDHESLRKDLDRLEAAAKQVLDGERPLLGSLRGEAEALLARLETHMRWEERHLVPTLRRADAWGEERASRLESDHQQQRELLRFILDRLRDQCRPAAMIARDVANLVEMLRDDMREEEAFFLDPRVLRDDVIGIAVETG